MHRYAQTNLQLYAQVQEAGWPEADLARLGQAYELAMEVCGGSVRGNGKPFLCHLVGTASILASWGAAAEEVVCGLLHSAYTHGVFEDSRPGMTEAKRAAVRRAVGDECEALIAGYTELRWKGGAVEEWAAKVDSLTTDEQGGIRVRLANDLEEHLDLGMRYSRKRKYKTALEPTHPLLVLAERLVSRELAAELSDAIAANVTATVADVLVRSDDRSILLAS